MTFSFTIEFAYVFTLALVLTNAVLFALVKTGAQMLARTAERFMAQVQKLIMANNIDRAIKLCNAEPTDELAQHVKKLLVRGNTVKDGSFELYFDETLASYTAEVPPRKGAAGMITGGLVMIAQAIVIYSVVDGAQQWWFALVGIIAAWLLHGGIVGAVASYRKGFVQGFAHLYATRNLLYSRARYVPPERVGTPFDGPLTAKGGE